MSKEEQEQEFKKECVRINRTYRKEQLVRMYALASEANKKLHKLNNTLYDKLKYIRSELKNNDVVTDKFLTSLNIEGEK